MRYSIVSKGLAILQLQEEVVRCGGKNLRVAAASKQIFADLDPIAVNKLKAIGCSVNNIGGVKADVMFPPIVAPPIPIAGTPTYRPEELAWVIGFDELRDAVDPPLYGEGVNVAVIGTGIRETHVKINGSIVYRKNYTSDSMTDGFDHDTGVCDIILSVAPLCNILNLKVLDNNGEGTEEDVAIAIDDCITLYDTNPDIAPVVINLSLGGPDDGNPDNPLRVACKAAIEKGIWVIASAGNAGPIPYSVTCPACEEHVFAIGSAKYLPEESSFIISDWSSRGPTLEGLIKPDAVMFGEDVSLASSASDTAVTAKSGTSFAAPFCSGMAVIYHEAVYRQAVTTRELMGLPAVEVYYISAQELMDNYLPIICIKPENIAREKDYDYGQGLPYGPYVSQALRPVSVIDISMITPIIGIALLGMLITPMLKRNNGQKG